MRKTIRNTLKNWGKDDNPFFDRESFDKLRWEHAENINNGLGHEATTKRRIIEVQCSSDLKKAWLVGHHSKVALEHLASYKANHIDSLRNRESSINDRLKKIYPSLLTSIGCRLEPLFTEDMLSTFYELEEYAERWNTWKQDFTDFMISLDTATKHLSGTDATKTRYGLFKSKLHIMYPDMVSLLRDLMALGGVYNQ